MVPPTPLASLSSLADRSRYHSLSEARVISNSRVCKIAAEFVYLALPVLPRDTPRKEDARNVFPVSTIPFAIFLTLSPILLSPLANSIGKPLRLDARPLFTIGSAGASSGNSVERRAFRDALLLGAAELERLFELDGVEPDGSRNPA